MSMRLMAATDDCHDGMGHDGMASCTGMDLGMLDGTGLSQLAGSFGECISTGASCLYCAPAWDHARNPRHEREHQYQHDDWTHQG